MLVTMKPKHLIKQGFEHHITTYSDGSVDNRSFSTRVSGHNSYECTFRVNGFPKSRVYLESVRNVETNETVAWQPQNPIELKYKYHCSDRDALAIGNVWNRLRDQFAKHEPHESYHYVGAAKIYCNPRPDGTTKRIRPVMSNYRLRYYKSLAKEYNNCNTFHSQKALKINQAFF